MKRFRGEPLPKAAKIAVIANDALGNYVVSTPLLQMLREKYPDATLHYYGGVRTEELWSREPLIDAGFALLGNLPSVSAARVCEAGPYDLVVNLEFSEWARAFAAIAAAEKGYVVGPSIGPEGRDSLPYGEDDRGHLARDQEWIAPDITQKYPFLHSGFIGEIFCRLAYLDGPVPAYKLPTENPGAEIPDVLIATSASLPEKLWPFENWRVVLTALKARGKTVGLLGAKPAAQQRYWKGNDTEQRMVDQGLVQDLRGLFSLPQVVGALHRTTRVLTLDNGILHLAAATGTPIVGLFREGIHRLWAPPVANLKVLIPLPGGAVSEIPPEQVLEALDFAG